MLDELFTQFELMRNEIMEIKIHQNQLKDEISSNIQQNIEVLTNNVNQITHNIIPQLETNINEIRNEIASYKNEMRERAQHTKRY